MEVVWPKNHIKYVDGKLECAPIIHTQGSNRDYVMFAALPPYHELFRMVSATTNEAPAVLIKVAIYDKMWGPNDYGISAFKFRALE